VRVHSSQYRTKTQPQLVIHINELAMLLLLLLRFAEQFSASTSVVASAERLRQQLTGWLLAPTFL